MVALSHGVHAPAADRRRVDVERPANVARERHPSWLRVRVPAGTGVDLVAHLVRAEQLNTVCQAALCPNLAECWAQRTATMMILGDTCTRRCGFCAVKTGRPTWQDEGEPLRVARAVAELGLDYVVVTSVTRDDLADGGASVFAATITAIRSESPTAQVEVLIPDFGGERESLAVVVRARPDVLGHNIETVPRLSRPVRKRARYGRSLAVLRTAKEVAAELGFTLHTKSAIMVGLGETRDEVRAALRDLRAVDCDFLTIGQYLRPSQHQLPVARYYEPLEFSDMRAEAEALGFAHVESVPLARSSYRAREYLSALS